MRSPRKIDALSALIERNIPFSTLLDVGVLTGTPELIAAFPDRKHVLFEPVVEFNENIRKAYAYVPHVLVNTAVSNSTGTTTLAVSSMIDGVEISHSQMVDNGSAATLEREVPVTTLDDYLAKTPHPGPYFLKIDIDGFELRVLEGATKTLENTNIVMIEAPVHELTARVAFLEQAGFVLFDLIEPCYYDKALWQCDALMLKAPIRWTHFDTGVDFDINKYETWTG